MSIVDIISSLVRMALSHLADAKDPAQQEHVLSDIGNPFENVANSQFGIVPNQQMDVSLSSQATPAKDVERAPAEWGTESSKHSSPGRRPGYVKGSAAELRARRIRELKTQESTNSAIAMTTAKSPTASAPPLDILHDDLEPDASDITTKTWDADKLDLLYETVKLQDAKVHDHTLAISILENKVAVLLGEDPPNQQSLRRNRYRMRTLSSPDDSLNDQYEALDDSKNTGFP